MRRSFLTRAQVTGIVNTPSLSPSRQPSLTSQLNIINEANINEVFSDLTNAEDLKICLKLT